MQHGATLVKMEDYCSRYHTESGVNVCDSLVHGHVDKTPAQAEVGQNQQAFLQPLVEHQQRLPAARRRAVTLATGATFLQMNSHTFLFPDCQGMKCSHTSGIRKHSNAAALTRLFSKSSRMKVMALVLIPMKRLMQDNDT